MDWNDPAAIWDFHVKMPAYYRAPLQRLAAANRRPLTAELREAIKRHIYDHPDVETLEDMLDELVPQRTARTPYTPEEIQDMKRRRIAGESYERIGARYGISRQRAHQLLMRHQRERKRLPRT